MILWVLCHIFLLFLTPAQTKSVKSPLYVGSMAPLTGRRAWWGAGITAAMKMAFEYINNDSSILPGYELKLMANDTMVRFIILYQKTLP